MGRKTTHHNILSNLGNKLQKVRQGKGITQEELAHNINMNRTYIGLIERGERNPTATTLYKICKALKVNSGDFLPF